MAVQASSNVVDKKTAPVSESANISDKVLHEFNSTYNAINVGQNNDESKKNKQNVLEDVSEDKLLASESKASNLFTLLNNYRFKDFIELALSDDGAKLKLIIKKNRTRRGVSQTHPISKGYQDNKQFMKRINNEYKNVGWLIDAKPGQTYNAVW